MRRLMAVLGIATTMGLTAPGLGAGLAQQTVAVTAQAPAAQTADPLSEDPYIRLMTGIAGLIDRNCLAGREREFSMTILGVLPHDATLTPFEKEYLYLQLRSAAGHVYRARPNVRQRIALSDVGEALLLLGAGSSRAMVQEFVEKAENFDIGIEIKPFRQIDGRLSIRLVTHSKKLDCYHLSDLEVLPQNAFPEQVFKLEEFLARGPTHVLQHSKGAKAIVQLRTRMADNSETPEIWRESMLRAYERSVARAKDQLQTRSLTQQRDIITEPTINHVRRDRWQNDIVMSHHPKRGMRLEVGVKPPEDETEASSDHFQGVVDPDSFPPLPLPDTGKSGVSKMRLPLSLHNAERLGVTMGGVSQKIEIPFSVPQSTVVEIDIEGLEPAQLPNVAVVDRRSKVIEPDFRGRVKPALKRWRLERGAYTLMLTTKSESKLAFNLRTRAAFDALAPEPSGRNQRKVSDWTIGETQLSTGERACYAFTSALQTEPVNWRLLMPQLYFQFYDRETGGPNIDRVNHFFDEVAPWRDGMQVSAEVRRREVWQDLRLTESQGRLMSMQTCQSDASQSCMRRETLVELTNGVELRLFGPRKDGQRGAVTYSLQGYQNAITAAAAMCGQRDMAKLLIANRAR